MEPIAVSPKGACNALSYGLTKIYDLINAGELEVFKDGRSTRITTASIKGYVERRKAATARLAA
ncbi:helix-turn-helix domain-containing protein [Sphingopyxis granuli]|uniref:helix-turn-helix domain-containing protein n=1 Tax=Sphingopyxis granuli TaxID=267128 RepID=UPI001F52DDB8|nr:excisionase family DNA-binding protein [Sphingopyxis granuli]UNK78427.1 helix-turn-helix domain-containing protein [Sphingopyxis granuli]